MKRLLFPLLILLIISCNQSPKAPVLADQNEAFDLWKLAMVEEMCENNPVWASYLGKHNYDDQLPSPSKSNRDKELAFWSKVQSVIDTFRMNSLNDNNKIDLLIIKDQIESEKFYSEELKPYEWNPSNYNIGGAFYQVINYKNAPLEDRISSLIEKLEYVGEYYQHAKENIKFPTEVHTDLAIQQIEGSKSIFTETLMDSLNASNYDDDFKEQFSNRIQIAVQHIDNFLAFLKDDIKPQLSSKAKSFRLGKDLFFKKFKHDIHSSYDAEKIYQFAEKEKELLHNKMEKLAKDLWPKYFDNKPLPEDRFTLIASVITEVSKLHVHRDSFVVSIRKQIPELEAFVQDNNLISLDPDKPLVVRETPEYMRGFAGASISSPGPFDANAETYYNVTPLDHYTAEQAESYLREYNNYTLQILNIHEAVPGHYTQLVYSNKAPSIIKSIFGNGAMIEGWAVYTELMMLENGYGNGSKELDLMYYKWNLRTVCNTILDYGIHVNEMNEEAAMDLMTRQAFQEQSEAEGKWRRARLSQVQLCSYFTGYYEIRALREEMKEKLGDAFNLKEFHEKFLSYGSAPVKYIRELMLAELEAKKS